MCKMMEKGLVGLAPRRKRAGFTQASFAEALGITRSLLAAWEARDGLWPSARWLPAMADLLGCDIDALYELPEADPSAALRSARDDSIVPHAEV